MESLLEGFGDSSWSSQYGRGEFEPRIEEIGRGGKEKESGFGRDGLEIFNLPRTFLYIDHHRLIDYYFDYSELDSIETIALGIDLCIVLLEFER